MKKRDESLMYPPMDKLLEQIPQKYALVLTASRRAKQIIREQRLNPLGIDESTVGRKPLTIALNEIAEGKVDREGLMASDIEFDDLVEGTGDMFPDIEGMVPDNIDRRSEVASDIPEPEEVDDLDDDLDIDFGLSPDDD